MSCHQNSNFALAPWFVLAFAALLTVGCAPRTPDRIMLGTWEIDGSERLATSMLGRSKADATPSSDSVNDEDDEEPNSRLQLEVTFAKRGVLRTRTSVMGEVREKEGTWKLLQADGNKIKIEFELTEEQIESIEIEVIDKDRMRFVPPNLAVLDRAYLFTRKK